MYQKKKQANKYSKSFVKKQKINRPLALNLRVIILNEYQVSKCKRTLNVKKKFKKKTVL